VGFLHGTKCLSPETRQARYLKILSNHLCSGGTVLTVQSGYQGA
jgi:hypothetical protein